MNRVVVKMLNGEPVGIKYNDNGTQSSLNGSSLIRYLGRIDERLIGRKLRKSPRFKDEGTSLVYISKLQKKNIRIENKRETMEALYDLYLQDRQEYRKLFDKENELNKRKVKRASTVAGIIMIGGLALGKMASTAMQPIDLENVATYDEEAIREADTQELVAISDSVAIQINDVQNEVQAVVTNQNIQEDPILNDEEITNIVNTPLVNVPVVASYDSGIENNIAKYEQDIIERSNRWGISPNIVHDIISQESSGGSITDGYGIGQFEFRWWDETPMTVHNFETGQDQIIVFSNDSSKWAGKADIIISEQDLTNTKTQISVTAIILQYYFNKYGHNIPIAIQAYNRGEPNVNALINDTANGEGISVDNLLADQTNLSLIDYAWKDKNGLTYFQEVIKHIDEDQQEDGINDVYSMLYVDENGEVQTQSFQAQLQTNYSR